LVITFEINSTNTSKFEKRKSNQLPNLLYPVLKILCKVQATSFHTQHVFTKSQKHLLIFYAHEMSYLLS